MDRGSNQIVVVGAGIIGLSSALLLAQDGFRVVVVARDLPGDRGLGWASPYAGADFLPPIELGQPDLARKSFAWFQKVAEADPNSGVKKITAKEYWTDVDNDDHVWYKDIFPQYSRLSQASLPPGCKVGVAFQTVVMNPDRLLPWIQHKLENLGAKFIRAHVQSLSEAVHVARGARIVVNASGLGARVLAQDEAVIGYRGQTIFVKGHYPEVVQTQGSEYTYVIPRPLSGGVILGGISQENVATGEVDSAL
ncbi:hypothetical protein NUW58_g70 [Xylaria curta]|uniref:Uncharacterized protein n=2 Tax=Xylaria curta TaxID=42375 RepID=A0ACC1PLM3_9PEZI|nr:hypothetical protein NUW58_g1761 [Xylaria curta]KAJ2999200.1 hypothetical protein NUW58_g70 [Xylaria curta]